MQKHSTDIDQMPVTISSWTILTIEVLLPLVSGQYIPLNCCAHLRNMGNGHQMQETFLCMSAIHSLKYEQIILICSPLLIFDLSLKLKILTLLLIQLESLTSHLEHYKWHQLHSYDLPFLDNDSGYLSRYSSSNSLGTVPSLFIMSTMILIQHFSQESHSYFSSLSKIRMPKLTCLATSDNWNQISLSRLYDLYRQQLSWGQEI